MKTLYTVILAVLLFAVFPATAQIVTTSPSPLQEDSKEVVLTYNASLLSTKNGRG